MALEGLARWLRHSDTGRALGARLGALYIRLVKATTRWRVEGREGYDRLLGEGTGVIVVAWHGRLFMSPYWGDPRRRTVAMVSNNRDGDLIMALLRHFRVEGARGSTHDHEKRRDKGGRRAYAAVLRALRARAIVGITPDGPRGPRMRAQGGTAMISFATGLPVQPVTFSTARGRVLGSWDRFLVPWPFGRGVIIWGEALRPPSGGDLPTLDGYRLEIEGALTAITRRADELCGRAPVLPQPPVAAARTARAAPRSPSRA